LPFCDRPVHSSAPGACWPVLRYTSGFWHRGKSSRVVFIMQWFGRYYLTGMRGSVLSRDHRSAAASQRGHPRRLMFALHRSRALLEFHFHAAVRPHSCLWRAYCNPTETSRNRMECLWIPPARGDSITIVSVMIGVAVCTAFKPEAGAKRFQSRKRIRPKASSFRGICAGPILPGAAPIAFPAKYFGGCRLRMVHWRLQAQPN